MEVPLANWQATDRQKQLVCQVLESGRLTYGPMTQQLEENFARMHGRQESIFLSSGTAALQIALQTLKETHDLKADDEVIVPAITFVSTVNTILHSNLKPVLVDVNSKTFNIDPYQIGPKISNRTRAILPVDLLGRPCAIDLVKRMVGRPHAGIAVVEDACEAMAVNYQGKPVGSEADIACYSTYMSHLMSTGVGGFVTSNSSRVNEIMRSLIWHGRDPEYLSMDDNGKDKQKLLDRRFKFTRVGYNFRLTEMEAALGLDELSRLDRTIKKRQLNACYLNNELASIEDEVILPNFGDIRESAWMFYPLIVDPEVRDKLALHLEEQGVQTRQIMPLTNQPAYRDWINPKDYPNADFINKAGLLVGCHQYLTNEQICYMAKSIRSYYD